MSTQEKIEVNYWTTIITRTILTVLATLASIIFWDIRNSIEDIKNDVKSVSTSVNEMDRRLLKVELKLEKK